MRLIALRRTVWTLKICFGLFVGLGAAAVTGCGHGAVAETKETATPAEIPELRAAVLIVEPSKWPTVVRAQGSLIADEMAIVGAKVAGRVSQVNFDLGDVVKSSSVLALLDQNDFKLQVALAEAQLLQSRAALGLEPEDPLEKLDPEQAPPVREAKAMWDETRTRVARVRQLQLHTRNTVTQEEIDTAVAAEGAAAARHAAAVNAVREKIAQISVRESERDVARQRLEDTVIHAPFNGLVRERHVSHGSFVQVGDPIATLVRTSIVRFRGTVPERYAHQLSLGQEVQLTIEGVARVAKVTRISPTVDEASRSLTFEASMDNIDRETVLRLLEPIESKWATLDADGDDELVREEFASYLMRASRGRISLDLGRYIFRMSDENRDGFLSVDELRNMPSPELRTGIFAEGVVVVDADAESMVIPRSALMEFAGTEKVWKVVNGVAKEHVVQTGRRADAEIEIKNGLGTGDMILANAAQGRVARIDPVVESRGQPGASAGEEALVGEELGPQTEISIPAASARDRSASR